MQKSLPDSRFTCLLRSGAEDVAVAIEVGKVPITEAAEECALLDDMQASVLDMSVAGYDVRVDCRIARILSLFAYDPDVDEKLAGYEAVILGFPRQPLTFMVCRRFDNGVLQEINSFDLFPVVSFEMFQKAIVDALEQCEIRISKTALTRGHIPSELYSYYVSPRIGLVKASIRLDIACAALKVKGNTDAYGDEIVGVTMDRRLSKQKTPRWYILYEQPGSEIDEDHVANIDHVMARGKGGSLALRNLQLMRTRDNGLKGDDDSDLPQDRRASRPILELVRAGADKALEDGRINKRLYDDLSKALEFEFSECVMPPRNRLRRAFARIAEFVS